MAKRPNIKTLQMQDTIDWQAREIDRLKAVVKDYGDQIIERRQRDEAADRLAGQPHAWIVECPKGHEFDTLVFPTKEDADVQADLFNDQYPEGESPHVAVPLYASSGSPAVKRDAREMPTTADGVTIVTPMDVFVLRDAGEDTRIESDKIVLQFETFCGYEPTERAYSTREAAESALLSTPKAEATK